jgi:hypothetical protein
MHKIIEDDIREACEANGLSEQTFKVIKNILSKKINGLAVPSETQGDISRLFDLMKEDRANEG